MRRPSAVTAEPEVTGYDPEGYLRVVVLAIE